MSLTVLPEIDSKVYLRNYRPEDAAAVLELFRIVYGDNIHLMAVKRFKWQYEQNPLHWFNSASLVLEHESRIVGILAAFPQRLKAGDDDYPAFLVGDFMVHPDFRGITAGLQLAKAMLAGPHIVMGFPAANTMHLWKRAGALPFCRLVCYEKALGLWRRFKDFWAAEDNVEIRMVSRFDQRFDRLWCKISGQYQILQVRDSFFLNWRFFQCPHLKYWVLAAFKNYQIMGYTVVRLGQNRQGHIVDLFADRGDKTTTLSLIRAAERFLEKEGCRTVSMTISAGDSFLNEALGQRAFGVLGHQEQGVFKNNVNHDLNAMMQEPANWFLTMADSDMDYSV